MFSRVKLLAHIFNLSLQLREVPPLWKEERIVRAIPKSSCSNDIVNLRPMSLTPTPVKVMEKLIRNRMLTSLKTACLIPLEQQGFLPGVSTTKSLLDLVYDWCEALNNGKSVDIVYFDLSKAFDCSIVIRGKLLEWLESCLKERFMTVKVGNAYSPSGTPQGTVLYSV